MHTTHPFYSHCNPQDFASVAWRGYENERIAVFQHLNHTLRRGECFDYEAETVDIAARLNLPQRYVKRALEAVDDLEQLPHLEYLRRNLGHLSLDHLIAISEALAPYDGECFDVADEILAHKLTPRRENQHLITPRGLRTWLSGRMEKLFDLEEPEEATEDSPIAPPLWYTHAPGAIMLEGSPSAIAIIDQVVDHAADTFGLNKADALVKVLSERVNLRVTLNVVGTDRTHVTDLYVQGAGHLKASECTWLAPFVTTVRDITEAGGYSDLKLHDAPSPLRQYVFARDGHCRFPGCSRLTKLQLHHVIAFERGGPTTASNLVCLCQHHHNKITGGIQRMFMTESGVCTWYSRSGQEITTTPQGPLANPKVARFRTTRKAYRDERRKYWTKTHLTRKHRPPAPKAPPIFPPEPDPDYCSADVNRMTLST